jgi:hypothetical protein
MFLSVLHHLKIRKPTSQQGKKQTRENNKINADSLTMKMSHTRTRINKLISHILSGTR